MTIDSNIRPKRGIEEIVAVSQDLLSALREGSEEPKAELEAIANLSAQDLAVLAQSEPGKKAFWINAYNAFNLYWMKKRSAKTIPEKKRHFWAQHLDIGGNLVSLNDIEHGILRRSKVWWSRGYLNKWRISAFERAQRVAAMDPRVHFALNCGAQGCPPIRFYTLEGIEAELDLASLGWMHNEVRVEGEVWRMSQIFYWYIADFGGKAGLRNWVLRYRPELGGKAAKIRYFPYNHTESLDNFEGF